MYEEKGDRGNRKNMMKIVRIIRRRWMLNSEGGKRIEYERGSRKGGEGVVTSRIEEVRIREVIRMSLYVRIKNMGKIE